MKTITTMPPSLLALALLATATGVLFSGCTDSSTPQGVIETAYLAVAKSNLPALRNTLTLDSLERYGTEAGLQALHAGLAGGKPMIGHISLIGYDSETSADIHRVEIGRKLPSGTIQPFLIDRVRCPKISGHTMCLIEEIRTAEEEAQAIIDAIINEDIATFARMLTDEVDFDGHNADGITPLMAAVDSGHGEFTRILLNLKVEVNAQDNGGRTALMRAEARGDTVIAQLLRDAGAHDQLKQQ